MAKKGCKGCCGCLVALGIIAVAAGIGVSQLLPTAPGPSQYVRFNKSTRMRTALADLESKGLVRNALVLEIYARAVRAPVEVKSGTYSIKGGLAPDKVLEALRSPVKKLVRLPEGWWAARVARRLEEQGVCQADAYLEVLKAPPLVDGLEFLKGTSPEGFLFPDTYNLPPLTPPEDIVRLQLATFKRKVMEGSPDTDWKRVVTIASMVELEAAKADERARIAGVIVNRLAKGMALEIDATVLYALQEWKQLGRGEVRTVQSPYNTYLNKGLPPGPIGSPGLASVRAAQKPEKHGYFFYVARPDQSHYFAATYPEHLANIRKARAEWKGR